MSETITLAEIAKIIDVPKEKVKEQFNRGRLLEFVPRPQNPDVKWVIYRKDFNNALNKKRKMLDNDFHKWDNLFEIDALSLS